MHTAADYDLVESDLMREARARVLAYIKVGSNEEKKLIEYCAANIPRDRYVPVSQMHFGAQHVTARDADLERAPLVVVYATDDPSKPHSLIHRHALGQLCDIAGLHRTYANKLNEPSEKTWRRSLLAYNLNELFHKQTFVNRLKKPAKFLHRLVGNELRAVLTQSYNRHLISVAVLQPFLEVAKEVGLGPAKATITDMRVHLQTYLPYAFEPIPGEFVALGTSWSNSDFGQGKLKISHTILRLNGMGNLVTDDAFSRMHITSVVEDTDMAIDDEVARKELEAVSAATKSAVREAMKPEQVKKILDAIKAANEEQIPWAKLKDNLSKFLSKKNLGTVESMLEDRIEELPPVLTGKDGQPIASRWWAASVLAHLSEKQTDATESMEFKQAAGQFLAGSK